MGEELVTYLEEQQSALGMTARDMAARLGLSESNWSHIRRSRRRLPVAVLERAIKEFPGLGRLVISIADRDSKEAVAS